MIQEILDDDIEPWEFIICSVLCLLVCWGIFKLGHMVVTEREDSPVMGKVTAMYWARYVQEVEQYTKFECKITPDNPDTEVFDEKTVCQNNTYYTITDSWSTSGQYPTKPEWPRYDEKPSRFYWTHASNCLDIATEEYPYKHCTDEITYGFLSVGQRLVVHLNHFDNILSIETKDVTE